VEIGRFRYISLQAKQAAKMPALRGIQAGKMPAPQNSRLTLPGGGHPARLMGRSAKLLDGRGQWVPAWLLVAALLSAQIFARSEYLTL